MKEEYISISEFAKRANVSHQYIYKRLDKELQPYLQLVEGKKALNIKALQLFNVTEVATNATKVATENQEVKDLIELLQEQQKVLKQELDIKNEQIRDLSQSNRQQLQLIDQQQKLQAISEAKRLEMKPEKEETSLLNRSKFSTEAEYLQFLCRLVPRIGLFSTRADKEELERVLELMSEDERKLIYRKKAYREAIEELRKVDFDEREKAFEEIEREAKKDREKWQQQLDKWRQEQEELRQEIEKRGGI